LLLLLARPLAGQFAGSEACARCHPAQSKIQIQSAHSRSLAASPVAPVKADWAFGAGIQAITYVSRLDSNSYLEHGLSWYGKSRSLATTPGHRNTDGERYRIFDPGAAILRCFQCHSTGDVSMGEGNRIRPFEPGVRCEACHGPGADHVKAPAGGNIVNPKRYSASELNQLCGSCHRKPAASGDDTDWANPWNVRHQPLYLAESVCFRSSNGKLSCLTCHDPHSGSARAGCGSCHHAVKHSPATNVAERACVDCHMPKARPNDLLAFTNHWIGIYVSGASLMPRAPAPRTGRPPVLHK
jgi:hypothetical protein